ncbi:hypothetical protein F5B20DRAFT_528415 [Whalleya microplaca]|nr:hypothetical protein F5B20DRAFT_528415 [Whalleya microplaca]
MDMPSQKLIELLRQSESGKQRLFNGDPVRYLTHDAYCKYCQQQWYLIAGHGDGRYVALRNDAEMEQLIHQIQNGRAREDILAGLKSQEINAVSLDQAREDACVNSINLAARLLLMLKFGVVKHEAVPKGYLSWEKGALADFVRDYFSSNPVLSCDRVRLPKTFNAWSLESIAGIEVNFTDNLADHLRLVDDDSKVLVFHHASFLECHLQDSMFPDRFAHETLSTLALLFPQSIFSRSHGHRLARSKRKWFQALLARQEHWAIDPRLVLCGDLQMEDRQIERFVYWRDRLVILKQAYDDATPRTLSQWWLDRRNGVQWYTFWVAILVLIITTVLSVV